MIDLMSFVPPETLVKDMCKEREDAVSARNSDGLDAIFQNARDQYQGIDEVNRKRSFEKSSTLDAPLSTPIARVDSETRSTVFLNITRPYTNSAAARVTDIMLPAGNRMPWDLKQTPVSEIAIMVGVLDEFPELMEFVPENLLTRMQMSGETTYLDEAKKYISDALVETKWRDKLRQLILETTIVGTGVLKGPFPQQRKLSPDVKEFMEQLLIVSPLAGEILKMQLLHQPAADYVKVENFYPDPACGEDVQNGKFVWEKITDQSERQIQELLQDPSYFADEILKVLKEEPKDKLEKKNKKSYTLWLRTGLFGEKVFGEDAVGAPAFGQMVFINDRLVKINEMPLDNILFPYWVVNYEKRPGSWAGIGVPEQIETPQRGLNTAVRAGSDNMAMSVGFLILVREGLVEPFDGDDWTIRPYKKLRVIADQLSSMIGKEVTADQAFRSIEFPNHLPQILSWIEFWLKMAEQSSGLPLLLQGSKTSDSVGVTQQLTNNATANLRSFVGRLDNDIIAPFIQACYSWVQKYGPSSVKGDAVAFSMGSAALIVRETQLQALIQFGDRVLQPSYGMSPKRYAKLFMEANQIDPERLLPDQEELQEMQAAAAQPDPKVEAEQIRAQTNLQIQQMKLEFEQLKLQFDTQYKTRQLDVQQDANDTFAATSVATTAMKREETLAKQQLANEGKAAEKEMKPMTQASPQTPTQAPQTTPQPEVEDPSLEEAFNILGLS